MKYPLEQSRCLNMLNECTSGPKCHLPGFRSLDGMYNFKTFEGIRGPPNRQGTIKPCERRNDKLARLVRHSHPTTWNCIAALQEDEICSFRTIIQFKMGEEESRQNSTAYSTVDAGLQHMRYRKAEISRMEFYDPAPTTCSYRGRNSTHFFFLFD